MPVYFSNPMCMCAAASGFKALSVYMYLFKKAGYRYLMPSNAEIVKF